MPFSSPHTDRCTLCVDFVAGDVDFVHLAQVVSAGFPYHKVTIFLSIVSKYLAGNYFENI